MCFVDAPLFLPAPITPSSNSEEPEFVSGLLNLHNPGPDPQNPEPFELTEFDVDGAAQKAINLAATLLAADPTSAPIDVPDQSGLATFRTTGVTILRTNHARSMNDSFTNAHNHNVKLSSSPPQPTNLFAEDLIRGYRLDVFDATTGVWRSLHQRSVSYNIPNRTGGALTLGFSDEGFTQLGITEPARPFPNAPPDPVGELYVHDALFHWRGWSLAASRPGKLIDGSPPAKPAPLPSPPGSTPTVAADHFRLGISIGATPGSLPRLRFGRGYQFRVRTVDLAGNGPTVDQATVSLQVLQQRNAPLPVLPLAPETFVYSRAEPVVSPVLVPRARLTEGESHERLVIRSNHDLTAAQYAAAHPPYLAVNERHVVPPKTSQQMAEAFGLFDSAIGTGADSRPTYNIAVKEKGSLNDIDVIDIATGAALPIPPTTVVDPATGTVGTIPSVEFVETTPGTGQGYILHHEAQLALPYLPDPVARARPSGTSRRTRRGDWADRRDRGARIPAAAGPKRGHVPDRLDRPHRLRPRRNLAADGPVPAPAR